MITLNDIRNTTTILTLVHLVQCASSSYVKKVKPISDCVSRRTALFRDSEWMGLAVTQQVNCEMKASVHYEQFTIHSFIICCTCARPLSTFDG